MTALELLRVYVLETFCSQHHMVNVLRTDILAVVRQHLRHRNDQSLCMLDRSMLHGYNLLVL